MRLMVMWAALAALFLSALSACPLAVANAQGVANNGISAIELKNSNHSFVDAQGMTNVVGVVDNHGLAPIGVTMALNVSDSSGHNSTLHENLYGRTIYPWEGAPFKFRLPDGAKAVGRPYIANVSNSHANVPYYDTLVLNYTNMAVGQERVLNGTMKNIGSTELRNIVVYASVHDENMTDLDSVRSNIVPLLKPGEEAVFTASPDPAVKAQVYYYSCAGIDYDSPVTTLPTGDGNFIAYDFESVAKVASLRYENATDSIAFDITHYNPKGGQALIKIPQPAQNRTVAVMMDGKPYDSATINTDGKTLSIKFFVSPGEHAVQIQGVRNVPEFPFAALALAALVSAAIAATRLKAAFKIS